MGWKHSGKEEIVKKFILALAFFFSIPSLILLANTTLFAFTGNVFLIEASAGDGIAGARVLVSWITLSTSIILFAIGISHKGE